ncbi:hypothetical protein COCVIDRAFT_110781, partial [Bipolaris victoriae FI3]
RQKLLSSQDVPNPSMRYQLWRCRHTPFATGVVCLSGLLRRHYAIMRPIVLISFLCNHRLRLKAHSQLVEVIGTASKLLRNHNHASPDYQDYTDNLRCNRSEPSETEDNESE